MGKVRTNQTGFSAVELLLALIFVAIVAFIGVYVAHNRNNTTKASSSTTSATTPTKKATTTNTPTLAEAVTQTQTVYAAYDKVMAGQVLKDRSQWATSNVSAAEDLQFINVNKSYFTDGFVTAANKYQMTNTVPQGGDFLVCVSGIAVYNSDLKVAAGKLRSQTATVTASYTIGHTPSTPYNLPVTLKASGSSWLIDSIDLSSCGT
jgi:hypothetical protein